MGFKKASKKFILSDSTVNVYGYRLLTSGYQMDAFKKNPIGYLMHNRDGGVTHRWEDLAIEGDNIVAVPVVNLSNSKGQQILEEIENGFLDAASVGHIVILEHSMAPELMLEGQTGPTITKWYNREASLVDVPGNVNALANLFDNKDNPLKLADLVASNLQKLNIMEIKLTPEAYTALNLAAGADATAINLAVLQLAAKNNELQLKLTGLTENELKKDVELQLTSARADKKITTEFSNLLATQYAGKPSELKLMLAAMPSFNSVTNIISEGNTVREGGDFNPETLPKNLKAMYEQGWDKLHKSGKLKDLKAKSEDAYLALYQEKYGCLPNEKTVELNPKK